ncbi:lysophospholipid acyltransferase family protein [Qipengyuania atrilutea]|nr:lysophospholipid acyltransferase family protein [Actirhodobacter atriluteus]
MGARVERIGQPKERRVLMLANHVNWLDILAIAGTSGTAFVAKSQVRDTFLVGWLASLNRTIFVARENRMDVSSQIDAVRGALTDDMSLTVFPEGTTGGGQSLLPFKTAMLKVLEPPPPGVMVQPVIVDYGALAEWIGWTGDETGAENAKRVLARRGTFPLRIHFLEPFDPSEFAGRKAIGEEARRRMEPVLPANLQRAKSSGDRVTGPHR